MGKDIFSKDRIVASGFLSRASVFMALGETLSTSPLLIKGRTIQSRLLFFFYHVSDRKHRAMTDWSRRKPPCSTQQEVTHFRWVIERSSWFHFSKSRSHLDEEMNIPCCLVLSHILLLVSYSVARWDGAFRKTLFLNEPPENISPANTSADLSRFCPHMTSCICQYVQWKQFSRMTFW